MDGQDTRETGPERALLATLPQPFRAPAESAPAPDEVRESLRRPYSAIGLAAMLGRGRARFRARRPVPVLLRDWWRTLAAAGELEAARGGAFLLAPVLICGGATGYFALPFEPDFSALASAAALLAAATFLARRLTVARTLLLGVLMVAVGMLAGKAETWRAGTRIVGGEIGTILTGRVEIVEHRANGRIRLTLAVVSTSRPSLRYQPDRVRVTARAIPDGVVPGSVVRGSVRLLPPMGPLRPDSYDFAFESYFDRIGAWGFFLRDPQVVADAPAPPPGAALSAAVETARTRLAARIRTHIGGAEGEIAAALVAGIRAGIPEEANEVLRITGLAHVLSISGLHMALVAGVVIASLRAAFALFPEFASRYPVRKYAAVGALVAVSIYLLISGAAVAAERAYIMIAVMLTALLFDRAALTMRNLAIAALAILLLAPHEAVGPSFQMSFAATAALIGAYGWWSERRARAPRRPSRDHAAAYRVLRAILFYGAGLAATSIIAGTATGIFGAWHFQRVSPLGLVANLAAMPIVSLIVMPAAVFGMVLMPLDLDGPAFALMGQGLTWTLGIATWLAARTPLDVIGAIPAASVVLLSAGLVPLVLATTMPMRLLAVPLLAGGLASIASRDLPEIHVSEDGRLVALRMADGRLAVNRQRPNAFATEDWARAMLAGPLVKPSNTLDIGHFAAWTPGVEPGGDVSERGSSTRVRYVEPVEQNAAVRMVPGAGGFAPADARDAAFSCDGRLCLARHRTGAVIAHADTMPAAARACDVAALIVIADATAANPCPHRNVVLLTGRHLALNGSARIDIDQTGTPTIRHAIGEKLRPWHDHRRFSRAARFLPPYVAPPTRLKAAATDLSGAQK